MRNPLSAILQSADGITASLAGYRGQSNNPVTLPADEVESIIDAAQIICLCAQHQRRIVDDVLNLSKLDSALILVTPVDVQPVMVVQRALKMFEGELETSDIRSRFELSDSCKELDIDWVRLDPSRLLQVLINLITNAIKFTKTQQLRAITVSLSASRGRPNDASHSGVTYFARRSHQQSPTAGPEWGSGEEVFLHFAVQDTGRGLTKDEMKVLFMRFSQANPRTHVQYGGSGLGLFISRELTELLGGEIGVHSESGKGSTFAFYVKARRSPGPSQLAGSSPAQLAHIASFSKSDYGAVHTTELNGPPSINTSLSKRNPLELLLVEDNLVNQRVLQKQLSSKGIVVHIANHGVEALAKIQQSTFWRGQDSSGLHISVVLMDLEMPVMDGLTCARRIRELQKEMEIVRHVPIIAVTANARAEQIDTALSTGMVCSSRIGHRWTLLFSLLLPSPPTVIARNGIPDQGLFTFKYRIPLCQSPFVYPN